MKKGDVTEHRFWPIKLFLVKMLFTLVPHSIFCSKFVYLCILTLPSNWYAKGDGASPSIILAGRALLMKMLITLEARSIFC